eukprot:7330449-Ditylum_brightwellii.AAC.1
MIDDKAADLDIDIEKCEKMLKNLTMKACWEEVCKKVFKHTCQHFNQKPTAVIKSISQTYKNEINKTVSLTALQYHDNILKKGYNMGYPVDV